MSGGIDKKRFWDDVFTSPDIIQDEGKRTTKPTHDELQLKPLNKAISGTSFSYYPVPPISPLAAPNPKWSSGGHILPPINPRLHRPIEALEPLDSYIEPKRTCRWDERPALNHSGKAPSVSLSPPQAEVIEYNSDNSLRSFQYRNLYNPIRDEVVPTGTTPPGTCSMASLLTTDVDVPSPRSAISNSAESSLWKMSSGPSRRLSSAPSTADDIPTFGRVYSKDAGSPGFRLPEEDKSAGLRNMVEQLFRKDAELERLRQENESLKSVQQQTQERSRSEHAKPVESEETQQPQVPDPAALDVHAKVLADLQHKISKQSLELKTLQTEHDNLLAAFSRSQTRSATLQKKCEVAASENSSLAGEKERLQDEKEILQNQYNDMIKQRDEYRRQAVAGGGQYTNIVEMASKLEMSSVAERKRWKEEKDDLLTQLRNAKVDMEKVMEERTNNVSRIQALEQQVGNLTDLAEHSDRDAIEDRSMQQATVFTPGTCTTTSMQALEHENEILKLRLLSLETLLDDSRKETLELVSMAHDMQSQGSKLVKRAEGILQKRSTLESTASE